MYVCFVILALNYFMLFDMAFAGLQHDSKNIGDKELYKNFPSHVKSTKKMIEKFEKSKQKIIKQAKTRFTSGW